jgi:Protein of unknown function (DUF2958)
MQELILNSQRAELLANWRRGIELADAGRDEEHDPRPVLKLFNPVGAATWLLTELVEPEDTEDDTLLFGLCDLGFGSPELGYVSLSELREIRLFGGALGIERDIHFNAKKSLSEYAAKARELGRIEVC